LLNMARAAEIESPPLRRSPARPSTVSPAIMVWPTSMISMVRSPLLLASSDLAAGSFSPSFTPASPGWDEDAPSSWPHRGGYYAEGWWLATNPGIRGKVGSNHRTLSTFLNSLVRHNLTIEEVAEPAPSPRVRTRQLAAQPDAGPLPMFLVVRSRRL